MIEWLFHQQSPEYLLTCCYVLIVNKYHEDSEVRLINSQLHSHPLSTIHSLSHVSCWSSVLTLLSQVDRIICDHLCPVKLCYSVSLTNHWLLLLNFRSQYLEKLHLTHTRTDCSALGQQQCCLLWLWTDMAVRVDQYMTDYVLFYMTS